MVDTDTKDRTTGGNSTYPKVAVKCFVGQFCVYLNGSSPDESWCVNRHLRVAAIR